MSIGDDGSWGGGSSSSRSSSDDSWSAYDRPSSYSSRSRTTSYDRGTSTYDDTPKSTYSGSRSYDTGFDPPAPKSAYTSTYTTSTRTTSTRSVDMRAVSHLDISAKPLSSSKKNVIIAAIDMTGSMSSWLEEFFKFLPTLHNQASSLLGGETEILFVTFGDFLTDDEVNVVDFGSGPELDTHLTALNVRKGGGSNSIESPEMALDYIDRYIDLSKSQNIYTFVVTDEGIADTVSRRGFQVSCPNLAPGDTRLTKDLIASLRIKTEIAVIFGSIGYSSYTQEGMKKTWQDVLGQTPLLPLERANLVVEVMLAYIAKKNNKMDAFTKAYDDRRGTTTYGAENLSTVMKTVALVPDAPSHRTVTTSTKSLIPGTKSLSTDSGTAAIAASATSGPKIDLVLDKGTVVAAPTKAVARTVAKSTKSLL